jgi:hypothetical protein
VHPFELIRGHQNRGGLPAHDGLSQVITLGDPTLHETTKRSL